MNTAEVFAADQDFRNALLVLQGALHVAKSPSETEMVQGRIDQIKAFQQRENDSG